MRRTFKNGSKVILDDSCEGTVVDYNPDLEAYVVAFEDGNQELAFEHQLEELED